MSSIRITKILTILLILLVIPVSKNVIAQEECDEDGFIVNSYCPCPPDPGLASVCGFVSDANITQDAPESGIERAIWSTRLPVPGATVSIYENHPDIPTGKPFGNLEHKFSECETTEEEGKYHCLMRRLNPGNTAYVIFSCDGRVADIKAIPSVKSYIGLDSDVDCSGEYEYTALDDVLDFAERNKFLGCTVDGSADHQAGFGDQEIVYEATDVGDEDGDIRFTYFPGIGFRVEPLGTLLVGDFEGAFWEDDCLIRYGDLAMGDHGGISREYSCIGPVCFWDYGSVEEKCNEDPDRDGDGALDGDNGNPYDDADELTVPFRYDIPSFVVEDTHRVFETRSTLQREMQDPRAFAQYNHLMFGECVGGVFLRYYGNDSEDEPIPCSELAECNEALGDPKRNTHTALSLGSRLELQVTWEDILDVNERDPDDIVCKHQDLGEIKVSEIQPPFPDDPCEPGTPGCQYKLSRDYYMPQFFLAAGSVRKPKTSESINDAYGVTAARSTEWDSSATEADDPHEGGHHIIYADESSQKTNSGMTAIRISSEQISPETETGVMANRFVGKIDAVDEVYDYNAESTIWDVGGDVRSLCSVSSVNGHILPDIDASNETDFIVDNDFIGHKDDHRKHEASGTSTYANEGARARDEFLNGPSVSGGDPMWMRDYFDTMHRFASGEGELEDFNIVVFAELLDTLAGRGGENIRKSYAHRVSEWNPDTPSYIKTTFCIAEESFEGLFPEYILGVDTGYPGNDGQGGACYPWNELGDGEFCDVHPGPGNDPEGELRTCRVDNCMTMQKVRVCDEEIIIGWEWNDEESRWDPIYGCGDANGDGIIETRIRRIVVPCSEPHGKICLTNQQDTWWVYRDNVWSEVDDPPQLQPPEYSDRRGALFVACDLSRAGPMIDPGDIWKDYSSRITQEPFNSGSQSDTDPVSESANYTALAWTSKVEERRESHKGSLVDFATTNDISLGTGSASYTDPADNATDAHFLTAGTQSKGFGTGATVDLLKVISHPERFGSLVEEFPDIKWICDYYDPDPDNWCYAIEPPGPIDLDNFTEGACTPNTDNGACPLNGYVPGIAERILGAAGAHAGGVPGSLLLAAIEGEGGWIGPGARLDWTDANVRAWSEPWYARIPGCNDMVPTAQGPFGLISRWFRRAVWGCDVGTGECDTDLVGRPIINPGVGGGYHPDRVNGDGGIVVSKCNFIDAAYAAAQIMSGFDGNCSSFNEMQVISALTSYRGGTPPDVDEIAIAMNCR